MERQLKASVAFRGRLNKEKEPPVIHRADEAITALTAEGYSLIKHEVERRIGADAGGFGELVVCAAASGAMAENVTADDVHSLKAAGKLAAAVDYWLHITGVYIMDGSGATSADTKKATRRAKARNADKSTLPVDGVRVSAPTYGAIGGIDMEPAAKWLTDELIALFPAPVTEYKYNDLQHDITPSSYGDSITITAEQIGAYALVKYGKNTPQTRTAIAKTLKAATKSVDIFYTNADGEDRHYIGSLFSIDAPHDGSTETIGGMQFPITIHASDVFKLYIKSKYGRISLQTQRKRLTDKGFAEYEAIKCWAASVAPYMVKEVRRRGAYTRTMQYTAIKGYEEAEKSTRSRTRQRARTAAETYAKDNSTDEVAIMCSVGGSDGITFTWSRVKK